MQYQWLMMNQDLLTSYRMKTMKSIALDQITLKFNNRKDILKLIISNKIASK